MVKSYYLAGAASAVCVVLITFAVSSAIFLLNDITSFYSEAQEELVEFKDLANNVWDYMVYDASPEELREAENLDREREERIKRSYDDLSGYGRDPIVTTSTSPSPPPTTSASTTDNEDEQGYDFPSQDTGPPSSRPKKPEPPTMPRIIQGFRAPPPQATTTLKPPFLSNQNYNKPRISNFNNNGHEPARPYQPYHTGNTPPPYNPIPNTQNPRQPGGEYDTGTVPPTWPKVYNTRAPNYPNNPGSESTNRPHSFSTYGSEYPGQPFPTILPPGYSTPGYDNSGRPLPNTRQPLQPDNETPGRNYPTTRTPPNYSTAGYDSDRSRPNTNRPPNNGTPGNDRMKGGFQPPPSSPSQSTPSPHNTGRLPGNDQRQPSSRNPNGQRVPETNRPHFPTRTNGRGPNRNQCDMCGQQPNNCPPGPVGPRGRPGPPGFPGQDGPRGLRGLNGEHVAENSQTPNYDPIIGCIQCPLGPPGERGPDGPQGPPGDDGVDGEAGYSGKDGEPGNPGPEGYPGMRGTPGRPGKPGIPGRAGQACRSVPGPPGVPGTVGYPGRDGDPGIDGEHGQDGSPGIQGPPGRDGVPGQDGPEGQSKPGPPGIDAGYCPCPKRSSKYELSEDSYHPQPSARPRDHSAEVDAGKRQPSRDRESVYSEQESDYERPRYRKYEDSVEPRNREYNRPEHSNYESSQTHESAADAGVAKHPRYESEDGYTNTQPSAQARRVHPRLRHQPRQKLEDDVEQASPKREYEERDGNEKSNYEGESGTDQRRPVQEYESDKPRKPESRPLKKVEIPGKHANFKPSHDNNDETSRKPEYSTETSLEEDSADRKSVHPPGIRYRRPHHDREREEELPKVKATERYRGNEQDGYEDDRRKGRYEDISKSRDEKKQPRDKKEKEGGGRHGYDTETSSQNENRPSKSDTKAYLSTEEQYDSRPTHVNTKDNDQETPYKPDSKSRSSYESEGKPSRNEPLPSETVPYRRRLRFYRNKYYEKYLV